MAKKSAKSKLSNNNLFKQAKPMSPVTSKVKTPNSTSKKERNKNSNA